MPRAEGEGRQTSMTEVEDSPSTPPRYMVHTMEKIIMYVDVSPAFARLPYIDAALE